MKLNEIKPNERNPRTITKDKLEKLKKSIKDFDKMMSLRPIVVDENNVILGGNMRYNALKALGYKEIPDEWVKKAEDLTEDEKKRFIIEDNVGFGEWDWDMLANEWEVSDLQEWGLDLPNFEVEEEAKAEEDDFSEETDDIETRCQRGDIWQLGEHRLMCGDSTKAEDVAELMDGEKADLVFTDPHYGIKTKGGRQQTFSKHGMTDIENDNIIGEELVLFLKSVFKAMPLKDDASVYVCYAWKTQAEFTEAIIQSGLTSKACIVWDKKVFGLNGSQHGYRPQHELIYFASKGNYKWYGDKSQSDIWQVSREINRDEQGNHPTPKPIALCAKAITNSSREGEIVLDVFGGSGSTLIACEQLKRKCYMMELDPHYCDVILARWEKLTGKTATKI